MKDELIKKEKELQEQKKIEQKKEKKSIQIFVIVLIIGLIAGIGAGMFARNMKDVISNLGVIISQNRDLLSIIVSSVMLLMNMGYGNHLLHTVPDVETAGGRLESRR